VLVYTLQRNPTMPKIHYSTYGPQGQCKHKHRSLLGAARCAQSKPGTVDIYKFEDSCKVARITFDCRTPFMYEVVEL
jgi:hypothetical protein